MSWSFCRGEGGSKKELIDTAKAIAEHSAIVTKLAKGLAAECTDKRMRTVCTRLLFEIEQKQNLIRFLINAYI